MTERLLFDLASIIVLGIGAQWLGWRLRIPAILPLLLFGLLAGPLTGYVRPDELLGDLLLPIVSLSVAVILFEGGLTLNIRELPAIGRTLWRLLSIGVLVAWAVGAGAAYWLLNLDLGLAVLLGAILVVTGPTVIGPLLRSVRPSGSVGAILRWEGIIVDPIGALLAVLVFEALHVGEVQQAPPLVVLVILKTVVLGSACGLAGAGALFLLLRRYWVPDYLQSPMALMLVLASFVCSNGLQEESGLLAVTVMGIALANQRRVAVRHIVEFKENLRVVLIASLFILLAARLQLEAITQMGLSELAFVGALFIVARPASVALSTIGTDLSWRERLFLAWVAPRGIVAAAVASIFALRLAETGYADAERLVPLTFLVIISTVAVYGLAAAPLARWLKVAAPDPQGAVIVGAHAWARAIATSLQEAGFRAVLVDTNYANIAVARMANLPAYYGNILAAEALDRLDMSGIGRLLALTPNDEVNTLATLRLTEVFGRGEVYQLASKDHRTQQEGPPHELQGRLLFAPGLTYAQLHERFTAGATIKKTPLSERFDYAAFRARYGNAVLPLFVMDETGGLLVCTADTPLTPQPGQTLISLVPIAAEELETLPVRGKAGGTRRR